jgi:hypothetical protein
MQVQAEVFMGVRMPMPERLEARRT